MAGMPHRVRRLLIRVRTGSEPEAFALRAAVRSELSESLLPAIERAFDAISVGDELIAIPRIEARVALDGAAAIERDLPALLHREIEETLRAALKAKGVVLVEEDSSSLKRGVGVPAPSTAGGPRGAPGFPAVPGGADSPEAEAVLSRSERTAEGGPRARPPARNDIFNGAGEGQSVQDTDAPEKEPRHPGQAPSSTGAPTPEAVQRSRAPESQTARVAMLRAYLETGQLPWTLAGVSRTIAVEELRAVAAEALPHLAPRAARIAPSLRIVYFFRLVQLLPSSDWPALARAVAEIGGGQFPLSDVAAILAGAPSAAMSLHARIQLLAVALSVALSPSEAPVLSAARDAIAALAPASNVPVSPEARRSPAIVESLHEPAKAFFRALAETTAESPGSRVSGAPAQGTAPPAVPRVPSAGAPPALDRAAARPERSISLLDSVLASVVQPPPQATSAANAPLAHPVSHAGLILLHPYLARFFASLGIKPAADPESPRRAALAEDDLPRAAALLYLLATGEEDDVSEIDLGFIKVLLGLPMTAPLPVAAGLLGDADREEAGALLDAVIEHWTALKKTSARGLRATFLMRRGLLREDEQGFFLRVEPAPFDVLLAHLPWGVATVKLPWATKILFTEWPS